ncbi:histidine kinase [Thermaurantimonas aggregans]|uniref:histidine kinase n=1 Tax=Thermaurantimonas aggregans TaxID=2173829 RepID=A0A401XIZ1_9FLAO|nr:tetratricopeptide repeat-containing sensor histidine kinase [Thermaurantimonas aggregans]GCD76995.1 histidine kinase [Thermaurantimonas aggregans]
MIRRIFVVRSFGDQKSIDELLKKINEIPDEDYAEEREIVKNFLYIRKSYLDKNLPLLFYYFDLNAKLKTDNIYLDIQKNQHTGIYFLLFDSLDKAIDEFFRFASYEQMQDSSLLSISNYQAAQILFRQENYLKAKEFFFKSIPYFFFLPDSSYIFNRFQEIYSNIALCYLKMDDYKTAKYYFQTCKYYIDMSKKYIQKNKRRYFEDEYEELNRFIYEARGVLYGNLGQIYILTGNTKEGIELLKKSIDINIQITFDNKDAYITAGHLINTYFNLEQYDSALYYMNLYFDKIQEYDLHKINADISFNALKYYLPKDKEKSLYYIKIYEQAKKNYEKINRSKKFFEKYIDLIDQKYALHFENERLKQEKRLQREEFNKLILLIIITVLVFTILMYLFFYSKIKQRNEIIESYNAELQKINNELETANIQKSSIMGMVAHDLRGPISSIKSLNELRRDNAISSEEFDTHVNDLTNTSYEVINDIIDFVKTEQSRNEKNFENVDINPIIVQTIEELKHVYHQKGIQINYTPRETYVKTEKILFKRLIQNLLSNALKFSHNNGSVNIRVEDKRDAIKLEIEDEGIGIPEMMLGSLFEPFTKASRKGTNNEPSHGLGMSIVKRIVDYHKGKITVKSSVDVGTIFTIELPK